MRSASSYPKDSRSPTLRIICESTKPTDESSKDQDLSFLTNNCFEDTDNTSQQNFSQENISIKLQLLVRTGTSTSRISLLSSPILRLLERTSDRPSDVSQPEEIKFCENIYLRPSLSPPTKLTAFVDEFWMPNKEAREAYVKNLKFRHALDSEGRQKLQSVVIFDWDGTLFHGTDLEETKTSKSSEAKLLLRSLDKAVSNLLSKAISYCNTYIITSFKEGLVESRSRMFLPLTYATIINHNVPIITMSHYDNNSFVIGSDGKPRRKGLLSIRDQFDGKVTTNMMFMVDSQTKVDMMNSLISQFEKPVVKMVKFKEYPKIKELIKQQELLYKEFENILLKMRNCTIHLSKKKETC